MYSTDYIKMFMLKSLIEVITAYASPELMRRVADGILDTIEDAVLDSKNEVDDMIILPLCKRARQCFNVPDDQCGEPTQT